MTCCSWISLMMIRESCICTVSDISSVLTTHEGKSRLDYRTAETKAASGMRELRGETEKMVRAALDK
jgi:hypothetical protein